MTADANDAVQRGDEKGTTLVCLLLFICVKSIALSVLAYLCTISLVKSKLGLNNYDNIIAMYAASIFFGSGGILFPCIGIWAVLRSPPDSTSQSEVKNARFIIWGCVSIIVAGTLLTPGLLLKDEAAAGLNFWSKFDYLGSMNVTGMRTNDWAKEMACDKHPTVSCDVRIGKFDVSWTTLGGKDCLSTVFDHACAQDICLYDHQVEKSLRCPGSDEQINSTIEPVFQCMLERYNYTTPKTLTLYGNSATCQATMMRGDAYGFYRHCYTTSKWMLGSALILLGPISVFALVQHRRQCYLDCVNLGRDCVQLGRRCYSIAALLLAFYPPPRSDRSYEIQSVNANESSVNPITSEENGIWDTEISSEEYGVWDTEIVIGVDQSNTFV